MVFAWMTAEMAPSCSAESSPVLTAGSIFAWPSMRLPHRQQTNEEVKKEEKLPKANSEELHKVNSEKLFKAIKIKIFN